MARWVPHAVPTADIEGLRVPPEPYSGLVRTPCRFCGATNRQITNEHVWPEWLADYLPTFRRHGHSERWSSAAGRQRWRQPLLMATVRVFCDACNSGWMSEIEAGAKPIVGPMMTGLSVELDPAAQRVVANWAVLKGLVAVQTSQTEQPIQAKQYHDVYSARGAPTDTVRVWVGRQDNLADPLPGRVILFDSHFMPLTNVARGFPTNPALNKYIASGGMLNATTFRVGHFFALVLHHDWPGLQVRPVPGTAAEHCFVPIWPVGPTVRWPPPFPADGLGNPHHITRFFQLKPPEMTVGQG
jgi:hypothetical protein